MPLSIRTKLVMLCAAPVLVFALVVAALAELMPDKVPDEKVQDVRSVLIAGRKATLEHSVLVARSAVASIYAASSPGDVAARNKAIALVREMTKGSEDYWFGLDSHGTQVFWAGESGRSSTVVEDFRSPDSGNIIAALVKASKDDSSFIEYKASPYGTDTQVSRIGYAVYLKKWDLALGTAVNVDDVDLQVAQISQLLTPRPHQWLQWILISGIAIATFSTVLCGWLISGLLAPLKQMRSTLDEMLQSGGDFNHRMSVGREDEIGTVARSFNRLAEKTGSQLDDVVRATRNLVSAVENGAIITALRSDQAIPARHHKAKGAPHLFVVSNDKRASVKLVSDESSSGQSIVPQQTQEPSTTHSSDDASAPPNVELKRNDLVKQLRDVTKELNDLVDPFRL